MSTKYQPKDGDFIKCNHYATGEALEGFYMEPWTGHRTQGVHWAATRFGKTGIINPVKLSKAKERAYLLSYNKKRLDEALSELRSAKSEYHYRREAVREIRDEIASIKTSKP